MDILRLSSKEAEILRLLIAQGEMYGLELVELSDKKLKRGTVYVTLSRMDAKGYVVSRLEEKPGDGPPRRMYQATGLGKRVFLAAEHLARPFTTGTLAWNY